jgi:hypothetical protein
MDGDLFPRITTLLNGTPLKESIEARRRGGIAVRRWGKEVRIDVHAGFDRLDDAWNVNVIEYTTQIATLLRSFGYRIIILVLDEHHGALRTYTPPADPWSPHAS